MKNSVIGKSVRDKQGVRYRGRAHSKIGRVIWGIGIFGWALFLLVTYQVMHRAPDAAYGGQLLGLFLIGVLGTVLAIRAMRESHVFFLSVLIGAVVNTALWVTILALFLIGMTA